MKKGAISIETIVIIILALLVLVIVAAAFSGGMKELWDRILGIGQTTGELELTDAVTRCNNVCASSPEAFCTTSVLVKEIGPRNCKDLTSCTGAPC